MTPGSLLKIAGIAMPAIFIYSVSLLGQNDSVQSTFLKEMYAYPCESMENAYLDLNNPHWNQIWYTPADSVFRHRIKKVHFKGENLKIAKGYADFMILVMPKKAGNATLTAKVVTNDKSKLILTKNYTAVELPVLDIEIAVTDPTSKFMWLNLIETSTGQNVNSSFLLCKIEFELKDKTGNLKEYGISCQGDEFFPSITLHNLPTLFELDDVLKLNVVVMHYAYNLPVHIQKELIIDKLWH